MARLAEHQNYKLYYIWFSFFTVVQSLKDEGIHVDTKELKGFTLEEKLPKGNHQGPNK